MSARPKETHAIQVFPFLAVLVCTMGALIFLLLLMTRQVRTRELALVAQHKAQRALARAEAKRLREQAASESKPSPEATTIVIPALPVIEPQKKVKLPDQSYELALEERQRELDALTTKWKLKTEKLQDEREKARHSLLHNKKLVNAAVAHANAVKSEVEKLEGELEQTAAEADSLPTSDVQEAEQLLIEQRIAEMKKRLRAAQVAEANGANDQFQVIPFDPQSGTTRRPILIECTESGIRFLPEDITITSSDMKGFTNRVNPLAAGTAALINYWNERNAKERNPRAEPEPYPLLLVRPNGVVAYYVAMKMLEPIRTVHGYELIEESTALKLPEVDPNAKAACQAAVDRMLGERENVQRLAVNSGIGGSVYGGIPRRVSSVGGGGGKRGAGGSAAVGGNAGDSGAGGADAGGGGTGTGGPGTGSTRGTGMGGMVAGGTANGGANHVRPRSRNSIGAGGLGSDEDAIDGTDDANTGDARGERSLLDGNATFGQTGNGRRSGDAGFTLNALDPEEDRVGDRSWERIENFEGRSRQQRRGESTEGLGDRPEGNVSGRKQGKIRNTSSKRSPGGGGSNGSDVGDSSITDSTDGNPTDSSSSGTNTSGTNSSGTNVDRRNSSGANSSRLKSSGTDATTANPLGPRATGDQSADANKSEMTSSGVNAPGGKASGEDGTPAGTGQPSGGANGSANGNANAAGGRSNGSSNNQERWTSPGVQQKVVPPRDESGNIGGYGQAEPGMPIGKRPGSKASSSNQGSGDASDGSESGDDSSAQSAVQPLLGLGGTSKRYGFSGDDPPPRKKRGPRLSSDSSRPNGKRSKSDDSDKPFEPEMLVGRHWGFGDAGAAIGFEREVRVDVSADKLVIAERYEVPIVEGQSKQETFELFVTLLDRHSHEWGRPPQGFFWTPRLKFVVKPEGALVYEQTNTMMTRAGMSTSHEFAKSNEVIEYGRDVISNKKSSPKTTRKFSSGGAQ